MHSSYFCTENYSDNKISRQLGIEIFQKEVIKVIDWKRYSREVDDKR